MGCAASCGPHTKTTVKQIRITEVGVEEVPQPKGASTPSKPKKTRPKSKASSAEGYPSRILRSKSSSPARSAVSPQTNQRKRRSKSKHSNGSEINSAFEHETQAPVVPSDPLSRNGRRTAFEETKILDVEDDLSIQSYDSGTGLTPPVKPHRKNRQPTKTPIQEPRSESFQSATKDEEIRRWMSMTTHSSASASVCSSKMSDVEVVSKAPESCVSSERSKFKLTTGSMLSSLSGTSRRQRRAKYQMERTSSGTGSLLILPPRHSNGKPRSSSTNATRLSRERTITQTFLKLENEADRSNLQKIHIESSPLSKDSQYHSFEDIDESCELVAIDSDSDVTESHSATLPGYMSSQQSISESSPRSDNTLTQWSQWSDDNPGTNIAEDYSPSVNSLETLDAILNRKSRPRAAIGKRPPKYPRSQAPSEKR